MSIELNKVILQGRIAINPKNEATAGGTAKSTVSLATNLRRKNRETGSYEPHPVFNRVVFFGKMAETIALYGMKGKEIYVEGELETRSWGESGNRNYITEVIASELKLGADPKGAQTNNSGMPGHDDIPPSYPVNYAQQ